MNANMNSVNIAADNTDEDWITETTVSGIAEYAASETSQNFVDDYSLFYDFKLEADGAVIKFATVTREEATFIAECVADAGIGATLNVVTGDMIVKTLHTFPALVEAAENAYNNTGLSIFMETLNAGLTHG